MPTVKCPIEGYEDVTLTYPDEFTVEHNDRFWMAFNQQVGNEGIMRTGRVMGCAAICEVSGGNLNGDPKTWPLVPATWIVKVVYDEGLKKILDTAESLLDTPTSMQ